MVPRLGSVILVSPYLRYHDCAMVVSGTLASTFMLGWESIATAIIPEGPTSKPLRAKPGSILA